MSDITNDIESQMSSLKGFMYDVYKAGLEQAFDLMIMKVDEIFADKSEEYRMNLKMTINEYKINEILDANFKTCVNADNISNDALKALSLVAAQEDFK